MYKHLKYHLERLALLVLPHDEEDDYDGALGDPSDSHRIIKGHGRQSSLEGDFEDGSDWSSLSSGRPPMGQAPGIEQLTIPKEVVLGMAWERFLKRSQFPKDGQSTHVNEWMAALPARSVDDDTNSTALFEKRSSSATKKGNLTKLLVRDLHHLFCVF
jgi:hypothetical protein